MEDAQGQVLRKSLMWAPPILKKPAGDSIGALVATCIRMVTLDFHCSDGPYRLSDAVMIPSSRTQTAPLIPFPVIYSLLLCDLSIR